MSSAVFIYGLVDPRTEKIRYVGKAQDPYHRLRRGHLLEARLKRRNTHCLSWIRSLLRESLEPSVVILEAVVESDWQERETAWIARLPNLVNHAPGGEGGWSHITSEHHRRAANTRWSDPENRRKLGERLSEILKGRPKSKAHRAKLSERLKALGKTQRGSGNPFYGCKHSVEARRKMSEARKRQNGTKRGPYSGVTFLDLVRAAKVCSSAYSLSRVLRVSRRTVQRRVQENGLSWVEFKEKYCNGVPK